MEQENAEVLSENPQKATTKVLDNELRVSLSYGEFKVELSGSPENVQQSITSLLVKQIPSLKLAEKISLNYTVKELIDGFQDFVRITPEGPRVVSGSLSDKQAVAFQLVAQKIAYETGRAKSPLVSLSGMQEVTGLNAKSISSRLSELSKGGLVMREPFDDGGAGFRISTMGIKWLLESLGKKRAIVKG